MAVNLCPISAILQYFTDTGIILAGGKVFTYTAGTTTPQATYTDATGNTQNANPIILNAAGRLPNVSIWQTAGVALKIVIKDTNNNQLGPIFDQIQGINDFSYATQATIGAALYPRTTAEITAAITPTNYAYPSLNVLRYGAVGDGVTDDHAAVQAAFTVAGVAGGTVIFPPGYTFLCSADISVPVASGSGNPVASAQGPGWATIAVIFGTGATFGFTILGTGATTGGARGSTYNYAGTFRDLGVQLSGTSKNAFYINSVNQPRIKNCWIRGSGSGNSGCGAIFLNCLLPVFEDVLVTGCGNTTQYSVEFDSCTTAYCRGRVSGGATNKGGFAIDRCTNFVGEGISSESCGIPIVIGGKAESALACTGVILRGLELENPGNGNAYVDIGAGLTGTALVLDVLLDGMFATPSGTTTVPYAVRMQNISGFEAKGSHFTQVSATSCFELVGTTCTGVTIRQHRNLQSLAIPWVRYNSVQVLAAGPKMEWQLGLIQSGRPICTSKGLAGIYDGANLTGATPSILADATMGGYFSSKAITNGGATTVTSLSGGEPGMEIVLVPTDGNTTLTFGNSGGAFRFNGVGGTTVGGNSLLVAGRAYKFFNDGSNGGAGSCWCQL